MKYTGMGKSGIQVSRLCLGTMNFGVDTPEADSHAIMDRALEHGINFFDTADIYGWKLGEGITEHILGRWFAQGGGRREKVVLATKLYNPMGEWPNTSKCNALQIRRACDASLKRMQTDYIDLYQMHHIDRTTPIEEIWQAMEVLVQQGKILHVGSSNFGGWHIARAQERAAQRGFFGLVTEQSIYHLANRNIEMEVIPAAQAYGMGIIPWSPLGGGLLGGVLQKITEGRRASDNMQKQVDEMRPKLEAWEGFCREIGERPADAALAWHLHQPAVTAPIIGPRTMTQLDESMRALEIEFDAEALGKIDAIFPGKKTSPEEYAW